MGTDQHARQAMTVTVFYPLTSINRKESPMDMNVETPTPAKERRTGTIDLDAGTVEIKLPTGATIGIYSADGLPERSLRWLTMDALRRHLLLGDSPTAAYDELAAGDIPQARAGRPPKALEVWREAYACALADEEYAAQPGKGREAQAVILERARTKARALSKDALKKAQTIAAVVAHHERLTGATVSLSELA